MKGSNNRARSLTAELRSWAEQLIEARRTNAIDMISLLVMGLVHVQRPRQRCGTEIEKLAAHNDRTRKMINLIRAVRHNS